MNQTKPNYGMLCLAEDSFSHNDVEQLTINFFYAPALVTLTDYFSFFLFFLF